MTSDELVGMLTKDREGLMQQQAAISGALSYIDQTIARIQGPPAGENGAGAAHAGLDKGRVPEMAEAAAE